jgi:hypothetical protein
MVLCAETFVPLTNGNCMCNAMIHQKKTQLIFQRPLKEIVSHASILFVLKEFISRMKGLVIKLDVVSSSLLTSPPNMIGDLAIAHKVICEGKYLYRVINKES